MKLKGGVKLLRKPVVYVILALLIFGAFFSTFAFVPPVKKAKAAGTTTNLETLLLLSYQYDTIKIPK